MAQPNFGLLDTSLPGKIATSMDEGRRNRLAELAQEQQLQSQQQQFQLGGMQLDAARKSQESDQATREAFQQAGGDYGKFATTLEGRGEWQNAMKLREKMAEQQKAKVAQALEGVKLLKSLSGGVFANPTEQTALAAIQQFHGTIGTDPRNDLALLQSFGGDPAKIKQWASGHAIEADKLLPKFENFSLGNVQRRQQIDPVTGQVISQEDIPMGMTPEQQANSPFVLGANGQPVPNKQVQDYQINKARSGASSTFVNMPLEKAEQKAKGEVNVGLYKDLQNEANVARKLNSQIDVQTRVLDKGFETGWGKEAIAQGANFLTTLGVAPEKATEMASNAQIFKAAATEIVLQKQLAQKGPQTESDAKRIVETGASLGNTPVANRFILDVAKAQNNRTIAQQKFFDSYWRSKGTYEGAEEKWFAGDGGKSLFDEPTMKKYWRAPLSMQEKQPSANGYDAAKEARYQAWKAQQGDK